MSRVVAVLAIVVALTLFFTSLVDREFALRHPFLDALQWGFLLVGIVHFLDARAARARLLHGEDEEGGVFGYDFSHGYTSLERPAVRRARRKAGLWKRLRDGARRRTEVQTRQHEEAVRRRVDELLEKIHEHGMRSLSRGEQRFLQKASKLLRNK